MLSCWIVQGGDLPPRVNDAQFEDQDGATRAETRGPRSLGRRFSDVGNSDSREVILVWLTPDTNSIVIPYPMGNAMSVEKLNSTLEKEITTAFERSGRFQVVKTIQCVSVMICGGGDARERERAENSKSRMPRYDFNLIWYSFLECEQEMSPLTFCPSLERVLKLVGCIWVSDDESPGTLGHAWITAEIVDEPVPMIFAKHETKELQNRLPVLLGDFARKAYKLSTQILFPPVIQDRHEDVISVGSAKPCELSLGDVLSVYAPGPRFLDEDTGCMRSKNPMFCGKVSITAVEDKGLKARIIEETHLGAIQAGLTMQQDFGSYP